MTDYLGLPARFLSQGQDVLSGYWARRFFNSRPPGILVWQMGKVGSSSLVESLVAACPGRPVAQVHMLHPELRLRGESHARNSGHWRNHQARNRALYTCIVDGARGPKVVTLVREPVTRNISAFFQNLDVYLTPIEHAALTEGRIDGTLLCDVFVNRFPHHRPTEWFEYEMGNVLGVDVFEEGFDRGRGYQSYKSGLLELMVVRLEDLDAALPSISEFLETPVPLISRRANVRDEQAFANAYRAFKDAFIMPSTLNAEYKASQFSRTFYAPEDIGLSGARPAAEV